jgi:hypothetical protein
VVFSSVNFLSAGTRAAIDQALFRLMKAGTIMRVARGLYAVAGQQVDAKTVATSGLSRTVKAVGHTVEFRRMSQRKVKLAASPKGRALLALWNQDVKNLTTLEIQRATASAVAEYRSMASLGGIGLSTKAGSREP